MADYCNETKHRLLKGEKLSGCWIQLASTIASEIIADSGYDIALIDCEHAPIEIASLVGFFQSMKGSGIMPMVRAPWNDMVAIKRILDCGAPAIHIPYITGYEEAVKAVKYCKYPLEGVRGIAGAQRANFYGDASRHYRERANEEILVMLAIETPGAIEELDKIVTIPGLDGLRKGLVTVTRNLLKPFLSVVPFCLFLLMDIYWKYETRPSCDGDSCTPSEYLRHQKSIMKSQRNALLIAAALIFYWLLYPVTHLVVRIEQLNQRVERLKNRD